MGVVGTDYKGDLVRDEIDERVWRAIWYCPREAVADGADFEADILFPKHSHQFGVFGGCCAMTDSVGVEKIYRIDDVLGTSRFTGMNSDVQA